ncbi:Cof-type HAD-IIB family hydrolase [Streptococcus cristatus]|uniref:Hydrolase (HAD superfamily) n=1 Tax=Streptococcus cristatus TaxID=45634 RepID=A0A139N508_STRCR|nr:Cof-type HAD-IIB family hydrolase [Streptococcus cristatus]KXT70884.1 Hydrolase (HAD superfamily) [Streptococcus cristatus]
MDIKVIATDMDGTFLNNQMDYDRAQFAQLFDKMQAKGIRFVAISGNQYYQIESFFEDYKSDITIVGENGAYFVENGHFLKSYTLPKEVVRSVLDYLAERHLDHELVLSGEKTAYMHAKSAPEAIAFFKKYHTKLQLVDTFAVLPDDQFLKFSFNTPEEVTYQIIDDLKALLGDMIDATTSGHGNIDIIGKGKNKGTALQKLLDRWQLSSDNLLAFGDGGNDHEMLALAGYSYAMDNAPEATKQVAKYIAPTNDENGVLSVIAHYLNQ